MALYKSVYYYYYYYYYYIGQREMTVCAGKDHLGMVLMSTAAAVGVFMLRIQCAVSRQDLEYLAILLSACLVLHSRNYQYCVEWGVKQYSLTVLLVLRTLRCHN